jgi:CRP-like cAMP-binding protein
LNNSPSIKNFFQNFGQLSDKDWLQIQSLEQIFDIEKGEYFVKEGQIKDEIGLIINGCMRYFYLKDGEEITGEFWQENEIVAAYEGCILQKPSSLFIEAIEPTKLIVLPYRKLRSLSDAIAGLDKIIIALLENFIVLSQERVASFIIETPEERYLRLRKEMPGIEDRVHQKYIASFVGVTPVTLSRIRARLAKRK